MRESISIVLSYQVFGDLLEPCYGTRVSNFQRLCNMCKPWRNLPGFWGSSENQWKNRRAGGLSANCWVTLGSEISTIGTGVKNEEIKRRGPTNPYWVSVMGKQWLDQEHTSSGTVRLIPWGLMQLALPFPGVGKGYVCIVKMDLSLQEIIITQSIPRNIKRWKMF